jgi:hypothetical protein
MTGAWTCPRSVGCLSYSLASDLIVVSACQQEETGPKAKSATPAKGRMMSAARTYGQIDLHAPYTAHRQRHQPSNHLAHQTFSDKFHQEFNLNILKLRNKSRPRVLSLTNTSSMEASGSYIMRLKKMNILRRGTISLQGTLMFYLHVLA